MMNRSRRHLSSAVLLAALATGSLSGCSPDQAATVTLDIYSGRENPVWSLSGTLRDKLVDEMDGLDDGSADVPDGLGFRGFQISALTTRWGDALPVTVVAGAVIIDPSSSKPRVLADPDSRTFELLLMDARNHVDMDVLDTIPEIGE